MFYSVQGSVEEICEIVEWYKSPSLIISLQFYEKSDIHV